jgi:seryl-tRNA synthetase
VLFDIARLAGRNNSDSVLQAKQDATEQLAKKAELEKEVKRIEELALEKERKRDLRIKTIGNYVDDSVPISDNEVCWLSDEILRSYADLG